MDKVFSDPASFQKAPSGINPEAAMVVIQPESGEIKGVVGGREKKRKQDIKQGNAILSPAGFGNQADSRTLRLLKII